VAPPARRRRHVARVTSAVPGHGPHFELSLLPRFQLRTAREPVVLPGTEQRLLAFLALHPHPLHRRQVANVLWTDTTERRAAANLRAALWRLPEPQDGLVAATPTELSLGPRVAVDHRAATAQAWRLVHGPHASLDEPDVALLAADLLTAWDDEWVVVERERTRQLRLHALEVLCLRLAAEGRAGPAVDVGRLAVSADPLRESAQRALIAAHAAGGDRSQALRQYDSYRASLEALGISPSTRMRRLVGGLAAG
jgi:DNA-binding SARP family transcriptional activator